MVSSSLLASTLVVNRDCLFGGLQLCICSRNSVRIMLSQRLDEVQSRFACRPQDGMRPNRLRCRLSYDACPLLTKSPSNRRFMSPSTQGLYIDAYTANSASSSRLQHLIALLPPLQALDAPLVHLLFHLCEPLSLFLHGTLCPERISSPLHHSQFGLL
jgi:hypothetical protein